MSQSKSGGCEALKNRQVCSCLCDKGGSKEDGRKSAYHTGMTTCNGLHALLTTQESKDSRASRSR